MKLKSVMVHDFSLAPSISDMPRSSFNRSFGHKTTIDADYLYPVFWDEALPGDTFSVTPYVYARLNTPEFPILDNMQMNIEFFAVPERILWEDFKKMMGEEIDPGDGIDFTMPTIAAPASTGFSALTLADYLGIPPGVPDITVRADVFRAYASIYNEWYRDQNLIDSLTIDLTSGSDTTTNTALQKRGKKHDYFTSCLPWLQKGDAQELPLGTSAPLGGFADVTSDGTPMQLSPGSASGTPETVTHGTTPDRLYTGSHTSTMYIPDGADFGGRVALGTATGDTPYADLSSATAATINQLRQAFQIQKLLERDARSGTRYAEIIKSHFGVTFPDIRYRPEFLGGANSGVRLTPVSQTGTGATGVLAAYGEVSIMGKGGFTKSFTEHTIIMGILSVRADLTYSQGVERAWWRSTRYDWYWPALAHIGEQSVLKRELYVQDPTQDTGSTGTADNDRVFGYQERWAEYRYKNSLITGKLRSAHATSLDAWHLSEEFGSLPSLNQTFIESTTPIDRVVQNSAEPDFLVDMYFDMRCTRPMPMYSVPGLIDHF
jgi:hypothetical protein